MSSSRVRRGCAPIQSIRICSGINARAFRRLKMMPSANNNMVLICANCLAGPGKQQLALMRPSVNEAEQRLQVYSATNLIQSGVELRRATGSIGYNHLRHLRLRYTTTFRLLVSIESCIQAGMHKTMVRRPRKIRSHMQRMTSIGHIT